MSADALFGQGIFEDLQRKIDEDTTVKDVSGGGNRTKSSRNGKYTDILSFQTIREIVSNLEKHSKTYCINCSIARHVYKADPI